MRLLNSKKVTPNPLYLSMEFMTQMQENLVHVKCKIQ
jgi:hypothetical protein